jgi:hypothetical protein
MACRSCASARVAGKAAMRNNFLAFCRKVDVIKYSACLGRVGIWANQSTRINCAHSPIWLERVGTIQTILRGLLQVDDCVHGGSERLGSQQKTSSKNTLILPVSLGDQSRKRKTKLSIEIVGHPTYYSRRGKRVRKHSPTAEPSATVLAVARDLFRILSMPCGRSSSAPCCVGLAISAYVLRRFAFNCKEGVRHD